MRSLPRRWLERAFASALLGLVSTLAAASGATDLASSPSAPRKPDDAPTLRLERETPSSTTIPPPAQTAEASTGRTQNSAEAGAASSPQEEAAPPAVTPTPTFDSLATRNAEPARPDLWARIRSGFKMPDLRSDLVEQRTRWYAQRPDYMLRMTERASLYLFHIVEAVERRGMPMEVALLPFVESAFRPDATSTAKAAGMWQFIPATGRQYKLTQNVFRDDRRHVLASTQAALDYLGKLYEQFGDWHLALAGYNWGEGAVARAQLRNQRRNLGTGYEELSMPLETRHYVPKLQAIKNIIRDPDAYGLKLPSIPDHAYFDTVLVKRDLDVALAAKLADLPLDRFIQLNPSFTKPLIVGATQPELLLPYDNAEIFRRNVERYEGQLSSWTATTLTRAERPALLASRLGISEGELRRINGIPAGVVIQPGSTVVIPKNGLQAQAADVAETVAQDAVLHLSPDVQGRNRRLHRVRPGESLAAIARRYRVSPAAIRQWNADAVIAERPRSGMTLVVYVGAKSPQLAKSRSAASAKARSDVARAVSRKHASRPKVARVAR